jgi:hypothetical protein
MLKLVWRIVAGTHIFSDLEQHNRYKIEEKTPQEKFEGNCSVSYSKIK